MGSGASGNQELTAFSTLRCCASVSAVVKGDETMALLKFRMFIYGYLATVYCSNALVAIFTAMGGLPM